MKAAFTLLLATGLLASRGNLISPEWSGVWAAESGSSELLRINTAKNQVVFVGVPLPDGTTAGEFAAAPGGQQTALSDHCQVSILQSGPTRFDLVIACGGKQRELRSFVLDAGRDAIVETIKKSTQNAKAAALTFHRLSVPLAGSTLLLPAGHTHGLAARE